MAREFRSSRPMRIGIRLLALVLLAVLAWRLHELWRKNPADLSEANAPLLVVGALASLLAVIAYASVWPLILRRLGAPLPRDGIRIFLQSNLAKYVPGSVWHYAGRVGLARTRGIPVRLSMISVGIEIGSSIAAAAIVGIFVLPVPFALLLVLVLGLAVAGVWLTHDRPPPRLAAVFSRAVRRAVPLDPDDLGSVLRAVPAATGLYIPVMLLYGIAFWLTARALVPIALSDAPYFIASFAVAWLAGVVAVFAPGGIGVREAVIVALVGPRIGHADAIVIAAMSRIFLTGADLVAGGTALALSRLGHHEIQAVADRSP